MFVSLLATFGCIPANATSDEFDLWPGPTVAAWKCQSSICLIVWSQSHHQNSFLGLAAAIAVAVVFMKKSRTEAIAPLRRTRAARVLGIQTASMPSPLIRALWCSWCSGVNYLGYQPFYGITYSVRTFAIVTAAGLGNLPGVISAAFGIGLFEKYTGIILGTAYEVAAPVSILLLVLIWRQISMKRNRQVVQ